MNIGWGEVLVLLAILMLVFGAARLPQIGEGIGKAIKNLKRGLQAEDEIEVTPKRKRVRAGAQTKRAKDEIKEAEAEAEAEAEDDEDEDDDDVADAEVVDRRSARN